MVGHNESPQKPSSQASGDTDSGKVSFLDQALWRQLRDADTGEAYSSAWLALLCRAIDGVKRGVVVLGPADTGPFAPAAAWPAGGDDSAGLTATAELALAERRGVVQGSGLDDDAAAADGAFVAHPFLLDGHLYGVVALELTDVPAPRLRAVMRQMQWGAAWIEKLLQRQVGERDRQVLDRTKAALDFIATALDEERFASACSASVTELAARLACDRVSIGFLRRGAARVETMSHSARFGRRMELVRMIGAAMDEAIDQRAIVLCPSDGTASLLVTRAHEALLDGYGSGAVLTVPLSLKDDYVGALTFERPADRPFDAASVGMIESVAAVLGPILDEKRRNDRWLGFKIAESLWTQAVRLLGPSHVGRKLVAAACIALAVFFYIATGDYRVTSRARIEGMLRRVIVASYDGYIASQSARAGDHVRRGDVLATLDDKDLALERLRWVTTRREKENEYKRALAARDRATANIAKVQIEQAQAQIGLIDEQLERARLTAPFDGLVVSGDLSQSIGTSVQRGDVLFEIAALDAYRVILGIDEDEIAALRVGQSGTLLVASLPEEVYRFTVDKITPVAEAREGRNFFRVEGRIDAASERLRPGMEGVGKVDIGERRLIWIWTRAMIARARLWLWYWLP